MNALPRVLRVPGGSRLGRFLTLAFAAVLAAATATMALPAAARAATQICSNQTGNTGGYYYQMWSNGQGSACITLNSGNNYSTRWSGIGDFVAGSGWSTGSNHTINFSSSLNANGGTSLISLYGWSTNPLIEYYVMENYAGSPPRTGTNMGQMTSDGGTYDIWEHQQVNQPCITGNSCTFQQYLAIRTAPRSSGTITLSNFINAWASHGMHLGSMNYQIMATEAWGGGSGSSSVSFSEGSSSGNTTPPTSSSGTNPPPTNGGGGCTATLSAGDKGNDWYNLNVSVSGSNNWTVTMNLVSPAVVRSTWNTSASWPSQYQMVAKPNGNGNNFGVTISPNGQWTWPSVSCTGG